MDTKLVSQRDITFDIMKGIAIIAMILGHNCGDFHQPLLKAMIYSWHMPLFFFVSGYFAKKRSVKEQLVVDAKRLLVPYFIICFIFLISSAIAKGSESVLMSVEDAICGWSYNLFENRFRVAAIWFLPCIFMCRQIFNLILKYSATTCTLVVTTAVLFILVYYFRFRLVGILPFNTVHAICMLVFYTGGYLIRTFGVLDKITSLRLMPVYLILYVLISPLFTVDIVFLRFSKILLNILAAYSGIFLVYKLSTIWKRNDFLQLAKVGNYSLLILLLHSLDRHLNIDESISQHLGFPIGLLAVPLAFVIMHLVGKLKSIPFKKIVNV